MAKEQDYTKFLKDRRIRVGGLSAHLSALFPEPTEIVFEAGCGHGHFLTAYAMEHRENPCFGIDLVTKRIEKANSKRDKRHLHYLHFMKASVEEWLEALPPHIQLRCIFMLFPDPWPKARHHKNRMLQQALLSRLAEKATPEATLHFRSDDADNFSWALEQIHSHPDWHHWPEFPWPFEVPTYFQDLATDWQSFTAKIKPSKCNPAQNSELQ
jgi:tRNA (guanine-N7-)-methyltransferase